MRTVCVPQRQRLFRNARKTGCARNERERWCNPWCGMRDSDQPTQVFYLPTARQKPARGDDPALIAAKLRRLREVYQVPMHELAVSFGKRAASSWQHYETRFKKQFLPIEVARAIAPVFERYGCAPDEVWSLTATGKPPPPASRASPSGGARPISEEIADLRRQLDEMEQRFAALRKALG